jgi:NADH-quinone oxidoreductase subunit F
MLVQTIPAYRLPRKTLASEIRMVKSIGVEVETGTRLGKDFTLKGLRKKGYEAVFLGVGAPAGTKLGLKGDNAKGVLDGIQFLRNYNADGKVEVGGNVAIIGGGNVAVDVARTAIRLGAKTVTILYRRTREEMPAYKEEIEEALKEGVKFEFLVAPKEIVVEKGKAIGVKCCRMELGEFDRSGRRRPKEKAGDEFVVAADQVVPAIGQSLLPNEIVDGTGMKLTKSNWIETNPITGQTSVEWIFSGGDAVTGPSSVIEAIAAGEKAAVGIDKMLTGAEHAFWRKSDQVKTKFDPDAEPVMYERAEVRLLAPEKRKNSFAEVEMVLSEQAAVREARRCLRCDYRDECVS